MNPDIKGEIFREGILVSKGNVRYNFIFQL